MFGEIRCELNPRCGLLQRQLNTLGTGWELPCRIWRFGQTGSSPAPAPASRLSRKARTAGGIFWVSWPKQPFPKPEQDCTCNRCTLVRPQIVGRLAEVPSQRRRGCDVGALRFRRACLRLPLAASDSRTRGKDILPVCTRGHLVGPTDQVLPDGSVEKKGLSQSPRPTYGSKRGQVMGIVTSSSSCSGGRGGGGMDHESPI